MGGQGATPHAGAPEASGPGDHHAADEGHDAADEGPDTHPVVTEDLEQFTGADAHPSEPVTRPADVDAGQGPAKTDPDTQ